MASIEKYRSKWLRYHARYEKRATKIFLNTFRKWGKAIDFDNMTVVNYPQILNASIKEDELKDAFNDVYTTIGTLHYKRTKKDIKDGLKFFTLDDFNSTFIDFIREWLESNGGEKIRLIVESYRKDLVQVIIDGIKEGQGIEEISRQMQQRINRRGFYRWQARRIARTESTAASNLATMKSGEDAGFKVNKMWISAQDMRTRRLSDDKYDHAEMHKKQVGLYEFFQVPNHNIADNGTLLYPADPRGAAGNIINCRCTIAIVPVRDKDGNLIPTNGQPFTNRYNNLMSSFENEIRNNDYETAGIYDNKGNLIFSKKGTKKYVSFNKKEYTKFKGNILTHNHPNGGSFSLADIKTLVKTKLKTIRAVSKGYDYELTILKDGYTKGLATRRYNAAVKIAEIKYRRLVEDGGDYEYLNKRGRLRLWSEIIMDEFIKKFDNSKYFKYTRYER